MKNAIVLFVLLFFFAFNTSSQVESEIKNYVDSTEIIVNNGRRLLLQKIQENNTIKAYEIYNYLNNQTKPKNCLAFTYNEELFISCLLLDFNKMVSYMENYKSNNKSICYTGSYEIERLLHNELKTKNDSIKTKMYESSLSDEEKKILNVFFFLTSSIGEQNEEYGKLINGFKREYPNLMTS